MSDLRSVFAPPSPPTVGIEEEVMLLDPGTLDLAPHADEALALLGGDPRFKRELPAAQLEIITGPCASVADAADELAAARRDLTAALAGRWRLAGAGVHPAAPGRGVLNGGARYDRTRAEYAGVADRQLVFGLHVHVAIRPADKALAVYNAYRSHLPDLAALASAAPFYEGRDSGLASVRSRLSGLMPRQGVPPPMGSPEEYEAACEWLVDPLQWWWELRLHRVLGTLEIRVPDTQATVADTAAVASAAHALAVRLGERYDAGEPLPVAPSWRIDENRWSACRHGVEGAMSDPATGERVSTRERLAALALPGAERLLSAPPAARHRELVAERGVPGLLRWLADVFPPQPEG